MPKHETRLERLRSLPVDMGYSELRKLLEDFGWRVRENGTHVVVTSPRGYNITLVRSPKKVKRCYLRMVLEEVERGGGD